MLREFQKFYQKSLNLFHNYNMGLVALVFNLVLGLVILSQSIAVFAVTSVTSVTPNAGPVAGGTNITIDGVGFQQALEQWGRFATGLGNNLANGVTTDSAGNIYVTGYITGTTTFGSLPSITSAGGTDMYLIKYDPNGIEQWVRRGGGIGADVGNEIQVDINGNIYITGTFSGTASWGSLTSVTSAGGLDTFIVKYNSSGTEQWVRRGGGTGADAGNGIDVDSGGNVYITGTFTGTATWGSQPSVSSAGSTDIFLVRYDTNGTVLWVRRGGGTGADVSNGVSVDNVNNVNIAGGFNGTATFGTVSLVSSGSEDVFVVEYNSSGSSIWGYRPSGGGADRANSIDTDQNGNIVIAGFYNNTLTFGSTILGNGGGSDAFVAKLNSSGTPLWAAEGGGGSADIANGVTVDLAGNVYITGSYSNSASFGGFTLNNTGSTDVFVVSYDTNGLVSWARRGASSSGDAGNSLVTDLESNLIVVGQYGTASITFGSLVLTNSTSLNPFVVKYSATTSITIGGNLCLNIAFISTTQLTCTTPPGTIGPVDIIATDADGSTATLTNGFTYTGGLSFAIRNSADTASQNFCDLGDAETNTLSSCSYRLKVTSDAPNGYTISVQTSGGLANGANVVTNAAAGAGGSGGTAITNGTVGIEAYGINIVPGSITGGGTISRTTLFNAGATNSVSSSHVSPTAMLVATSVNQPSTTTDLTNTSLVTHNLNISNDTEAGDYTQSVTYTLAPSY